MKRFICSFCAIALVFSMSGCATAPQNINSSGQSEEQFAEEGPAWDQEMMKEYLERESDQEMAYAGPFYFGSFDGMAPASQVYSEQRREKVDELVEIIDEGVSVMVELDEKLREEREIFGWYVKSIQEIDPETKSFTDQVLGATDSTALTEALSSLMVMDSQANKRERDAVWGYLQFMKFGSFVELTNLYTAEAGSQVSRQTAMYYLLEADSNQAYQDLNKEFTEKMDPVSDTVSELISELYYYNALANYGHKLIFTADYYFAKDAVEATDQQIKEAQETIDNYEGGNELVTDETLDILKNQLVVMQLYRNKVANYLDSIPESELMTEEELAMTGEGKHLVLVPVAKAQTTLHGWFHKKLNEGIKTVKFVKDMSFAAVRVTGQKIKEAYDESGAHEVVKDGAQIFNGGLEIVNSTVEVSIYGIQGLYFQDMSWEDFKKKIKDEKSELHQKFIQAKLGKEQMDEIINQVDQFQKVTKRFVDDVSDLSGLVTDLVTGEPKAGKFVRNVTRSVGNEAKGVLDTATDFSKNLAIVLHPDTTKQQTREAMLNIYTALKGVRGEDGKLIKVELPNLKELASEKAIEEAAKELGLSQEEEKALVEQLKDVLKDQFKDKETDSGSEKTEPGKEEDKAKTDEKAADRIVKEIENNPEITDEEIADLIIAEILKDLPPPGQKSDSDKEDDKDVDGDGVENEYDNCEKVSNPEQTDTDMDSLGDACDPDCSGDKDSDGTCDEIDNCPEDANEDQADADGDGMGNVCDFDPPHISEIAGAWPGTITVREIYVEEETRKQLEAEGCDFSEVEASRDVPKPVTITINPTSETGGTLTLSGADTGEDQIPFTYVNGVLKAEMSQEEADVNIEMSFNRSQSSGSVDLSYLGGNATVKADLDLEK